MIRIDTACNWGPKSPANTPPIRVDVTPGTLWRYSGGGYEASITPIGKWRPTFASSDGVVQRPADNRMQTAGHVLKPATQREMLTKALGDYDLGLAPAETDGQKSFSHGGSNGGFQCMMFDYLSGRPRSRRHDQRRLRQRIDVRDSEKHRCRVWMARLPAAGEDEPLSRPQR